jgi:hypothetical protein
MPDVLRRAAQPVRRRVSGSGKAAAPTRVRVTVVRHSKQSARHLEITQLARVLAVTGDLNRPRNVYCLAQRAIAAACFALCCSAAHAQDIRDVVRDHLDQELEHKPSAVPRARRAKPRPRKAPASRPREHVTLQVEDEPTPAPEPEAPPSAPFPQRVLEKYLQLDVSLGGGYRGWLPQQYRHVNVAVGTYYVWTIDVRAKFFKLVTLHRGYYESNGLAGPRTEEAAVAAQVGSYIPKAAWVLGVLGFPWFKVWEPILRYESRAFHTAAHPRRPVCVVTDDVASDLSLCARSRDELRITSGFETFVAGVRYDQGRDPDRDPKLTTLPPITFGLGLLSYRKPYQVNVDGNTLDGYLFDGRFRGAGLQLGVDWNRGPDKFSISVDAQLGLGEVKLTKQISLSELAPEGWWMGYVVGNANLSYRLPLFRGVPSIVLVPSAAIGGATFFFFKTKPDKGQDQSDVAAANWDLLWSIYASLVVSL